MSFRFEIAVPDGRCVPSIITDYRDMNMAIENGAWIADRLLGVWASAPSLRPELRVLYPQTVVEVRIFDSETNIPVALYTVTRECCHGDHYESDQRTDPLH